MNQLRAALLIAGTDLRRRIRNRSFVIMAVIGPVVLAGIISLAIGGGEGLDATIGLVDADGSPVAAQFVAGVTGADAGGLHFEVVDTPAEARAGVDDGDLGAAVVVPAGFAASLQTAEPVAVEVIAASDRAISAEVARSVAAELADRTNAARLAAAAAVSSGRAVPSADELGAVELPVVVDTAGAGDQVSPASYFGPAMGLLFLFISIGVVASDLLADRRAGRLDRLRAGPVSSGAIVAGKGLAVVVTALTSLAVIWAMTSVALGADWGDPVGVALLLAAAALVVGGVAGLVAALARTEQSANNLATVFAFVFALLGGTFVPAGGLPPVLERLSLLTPTGWALAGFADVAAGGAGPAEIVPNLVVLVGWALVTGLVAARLLPRRLGAG